jgi:membrane protease YdiL (CAAX protease family)
MILQTLTNLPITDKKKQIFLFLFGWIGLFIIAVLISIVLTVLTRAILPEIEATAFISSPLFYTLINFMSYLFLFGIGLFILWPWIKQTFVPAILSQKWILGFIFPFAIIFSSLALNVLYEFFDITLESNQNQTAIVELVRQMPFLSLITFGLLGPIVEEWTYRLGLFQFLKSINRWLAYAVTLTIFGLIHFNFSTENLTNELLNLPIYLIAGAWFCFIYDRFGLQVAMTTHIVNNIFSILLIMLPVQEMMNSSL